MASDPLSFSPPPPRRPGLRGALLFTALAFLAGIIVALGVVRYYSGWIAPAPTATAPAGSNGNSPLFQPPPEADSAPRTVDAASLESRLDGLAARLGQLESRAGVIDQDSRMAAGNAGRAESLLVAFAARRAIDRGLSLGYLEGQLRARFGSTQPRAVDSIVEISRNPVTIEDLRLSLDTIAPTLATGGLSRGWWSSLHREIQSLVSIRKEGTPSPRPADRLERVRRMLDARDVEAALAEVQRLPGASQANAWRAAASRFVEAHRALDVIEAAAILGPTNQDAAAVIPRPSPGQSTITSAVSSQAPPAPRPTATRR